ncbi:pyridoxal phosphate-dependent decarboxylase family protein [Halothiobacillus sp.]|uniref:pyridoxal phosphate-dependent decarboxylase family protein n=1 Tax=Halothiobacillus sp. TaxID=1891311 RepID=UPI002AD40E15|nr:pyridoxal-dependent decarboxylase [Halothiobacillus sp.]
MTPYPPDPSFNTHDGLSRALELLTSRNHDSVDLPLTLPESGLGDMRALEALSSHVLDGAAQLDSPTSVAHMDPPTPWITWAMALWNASLNQNMLHEMTSPFATQAEALVLSWLSPYFGMQGGHFCAGSTIANLTGIWAARDAAGVKRVVTSEAAHLSIEKACRLLRLELVKVPVDPQGRLDCAQLPNLDDACLVLTAGTTATGSIDPLSLVGAARWTHVDAAWAGPLRLSRTHSERLNGIEAADSVAVSAHKWLFQPKDSALIMFRNLELANAAISFGGSYLASPNVGVQGSRSAAAIPLLATFLAWGREGVAQRLDHLMQMADSLADAIEKSDRLELWGRPQTAINVFRPMSSSAAALVEALPSGMLSTCVLEGQTWARSVAANPLADMALVVEKIRAACP